MKLRLGVMISSLITVFISLLLFYISSELLPYFSLSLLGIIAGSVLMILSIAMMLGKRIAFEILSIFYFILALSGILLMLNLPPEGLLVFLPSLALGVYLRRQIAALRKSDRVPRTDIEGNLLSQSEGLGDDLSD